MRIRSTHRFSTMTAPKAFALLGPTAGGKTGLSLEMAAVLPVEIISLDSALIYRGMDIGTAKPGKDELAAAVHHLIDIRTPLERYSAAEFVGDCVRLCRDITARGRLPLIVGGTMMYYHALTGGLNDLPEADPAVRRALQEEKARHGLPFLYERLRHADPATAARLKPSDSQRIERALEIFQITGRPMSSQIGRPSRPAPLDLCCAALIPADRSLLHRRIAERFNTMLAQGFVEEVAGLRRDYPALTADANSMRCVGYRQAWDYLDGTVRHEEFVEKGIAATRQLAKRQLTWLRKTPVSHLYDPFSDGSISRAATDAARRHFQL